jgi:response regulator RpfG family c-di-GMP phosphodiesterase
LIDEHQEPATILFVDDEPSILSALRRLFRPCGYRILIAEGGAAALTLMDEYAVDLVLSDMRMPAMDGVQLLEQVRARSPGTARMLLTGYADIGATIAAINRGEIHRYLSKPWDDQDLLLAVRDGLERRLLEQENRRLQQLTHAQNEQLQQSNAALEQRVLARTQELEQINAMLNSAFAQLEENFLLSIKVFAGLMEMRDGSFAGMSRRVAQLAQRTARRLQFDPPALQDVYAAGLLHEVGKIGLPDALLRKPLSTLKSEELALYRRHPLNAETALMALPRLERVARIVRTHQERIDGKGFPDGLSGHEVSVAAQIIGLASTYEALQRGRMSENKHTPAEAAAVIRGGAGSRHEGKVVQAFLDMLAETPVEQPQDRVIAVRELRAGMVLAGDLLSDQGNLLLASGFVFDARVIRQIQEFAARSTHRLDLRVKTATATAAPANTTPAH